MHELALAHNVVELLKEEAARHELKQVSRIRLRVGVLAGVVPELLQSGMEIACQQTLAEGATVDLEVVEGRARCPDCSAEYQIDELFFVCPECERLSGEILAGRELQLIELEGD